MLASWLKSDTFLLLAFIQGGTTQRNTPWHSRESDHMEFCGKKLSNGPAPLHYVTHTLFWFVMQHL